MTNTDFDKSFGPDFNATPPVPGVDVPRTGNTSFPIPGHTIWRLAKPGNAATSIGQTFWKIAEHMPPIPVFGPTPSPLTSLTVTHSATLGALQQSADAAVVVPPAPGTLGAGLLVSLMAE